MSFILDALRKSEHARERRTLPGLADVPIAHAPRQKVPRFLVVLGALLAVNLLVLLVVLLRPARDAAPVESPRTGLATDAAAPGGNASNDATGDAANRLAPGATLRPVAPAPVGAPADPAAAAREVRSLQDEAGVGDEGAPPYVEPPPVRRDPTLDAGARVARASGPPPVVPDGIQSGPVPREFLDANSAAARPAPPAPTRNARGNVDASNGATRAGAAPTYGNVGGPAQTYGVPSINDLPPQATAGLPALSLALHVYAATPAARFVVVNGRRYQEGATLQEGPTLERIAPDGVILNHRGLRFLLPRQ